jgi:hypothetical protein
MNFVAEVIGTTTVNLSGISSGAANETQTLSLSASASNTSLFSSQPSVSYTSPNTTGTLSFRIGNNQTGTSTITVTVNDGQSANNTFSRSFIVNARASGNSPPTITAIANQTVNEDTVAGPLAFTISDSQTPANLLTLAGISSNPLLVPNTNIVFGGSGGSRTVTVTPLPDQSGAATITVSVTTGRPRD